MGRASQSLGHTGSRCHHFLPERLSQVPERFCPRCSARPNDGGCWQQSEIGHPLPRPRQSGGRTAPRCQHGPQPGSSTRHPGHRAGLHAPPDPYALQRALVPFGLPVLAPILCKSFCKTQFGSQRKITQQGQRELYIYASTETPHGEVSPWPLCGAVILTHWCQTRVPSSVSSTLPCF